MKKLCFILVIAFVATGGISAQNWGNSRSITIEGTLQLQNGQIAVSTGNAVYFVPELGRYVGFIDGFREGARVSVSGYASGNYLQPVQMTLNGKSYDLRTNNFAQGYGGYGRGYCAGPAGFGGGGRGGWGMRGGCW